MQFIGYLLGLEPGGEGRAWASSPAPGWLLCMYWLCRVARPRGPVWLVLMYVPPVPCAFWGWLCGFGELEKRVQRE